MEPNVPKETDLICEHEVKKEIEGKRQITQCGLRGAWYKITYKDSGIRSRVCLCDKHKKTITDKGYTVTLE